jgi:hypothetical protein
MLSIVIECKTHVHIRIVYLLVKLTLNFDSLGKLDDRFWVNFVIQKVQMVKTP